MAVICFIVGILNLVFAINCMSNSYDWTFTVGYVLSGLVFIYIGVIGITRVKKDKYEKDIKELRLTIQEQSALISALCKEAGIDENSNSVKKELFNNLAFSEANKIEPWAPLALLIDVTIDNKVFPAGTRVICESVRGTTIYIIAEDGGKQYKTSVNLAAIENYYVYRSKQNI